MAQLPADKKPFNTGVDALWQHMRTLNKSQEYEASKIYKCVIKNDSSKAINYFKKWSNLGYINLYKKGLFWHFIIKKDLPKTRPYIKDDKSTVKGNDHIWRAIRMSRNFTMDELHKFCQTENVQPKLSTVQKYIKTLHRAGYLIKVGEKPARYTLKQKMNTGPLPPQIQRVKSVYDQNLEQVIWSDDNE